MKHKHLLSKLIETLCPKNSVGAEIGVDHADTTVYLLDKCANLHYLYAIDPYIKRDSRHAEVKATLDQYSNCLFLRKTSDDAAKDIPDDLDFIFIDGNHSYTSVLSDLKNYVPKIKSGGILTGHDWTSVRKEFGVVKACEEYFTENEKLFQPLYSNEVLENMGLVDFKRGGWHEKTQRHLIHKKRPSAFPLWWLIKR